MNDKAHEESLMKALSCYALSTLLSTPLTQETYWDMSSSISDQLSNLYSLFDVIHKSPPSFVTSILESLNTLTHNIQTFKQSLTGDDDVRYYSSSCDELLRTTERMRERIERMKEICEEEEESEKRREDKEIMDEDKLLKHSTSLFHLPLHYSGLLSFSSDHRFAQIDECRYLTIFKPLSCVRIFFIHICESIIVSSS